MLYRQRTQTVPSLLVFGLTVVREVNVRPAATGIERSPRMAQKRCVVSDELARLDEASSRQMSEDVLIQRQSVSGTRLLVLEN